MFDSIRKVSNTDNSNQVQAGGGGVRGKGKRLFGARVSLAGGLLLPVGFFAMAAPIPEGLRKTTFVTFDTETTGLSAEKCRVIEIGAVKFRAGKIISRQVWLINPQQPIPEATTRVHGLTDADVAEAPLFKEVYPEFVAFVKGTILVAHNAAFDVRFMAKEARRDNLAFPPEPVLDNLKLVRAWYPDLKSHTLGAMAAYLKVAPGRYHRAMDDSETLAKVFTIGLSSMPADTTVSALMDAAGNALYIQGTVPLDGAGAEPAR
jgi:DNA polymerase III epsilon subunit family exonuclease